jgi:hypothetical protein
MRGSSIADVAIVIVYVALAATLVSHAGTAQDINAVGNAFSNSLKAAKG